MGKAAQVREDLGLVVEEPTYLSNSASVYTGTLRNSQLVYVRSQVFHNKLSVTTALGECRRAKMFQHANVCAIVDYYKERKGSGWEVTILEERLSRSLYEEIEERQKTQRKWSENEILTELFKLLRALNEAEQCQIAHRNITPDNIFLSPDEFKLGNFNLFFTAECKDLSPFELKYPGTLEYMSPELRDENARLLTDCSFNLSFDYSKSDIYSLGVVFVSMSLLRFPSESQSSPEQLLSEVANHYPTLPEILHQMLYPEASGRKTCQHLLALMENRCLIPSIEGLKHCRICKGLVYSSRWEQRVPADRKRFPEVLSELCGIDCFEEFSRTAGDVVTCAWCKCAMNLADIDVVPLLCKHCIHSRECLFDFMKHATANFSNASKYNCPECKRELTGLERYFDRDTFAKRKKEAYANSCHICHSSENLKVFQKCQHILCEKHITRLLWMVRCTICRSKS